MKRVEIRHGHPHIMETKGWSKAVEKECVFCGKPYYIPVRRAPKSNYCSRDCTRKAQSKMWHSRLLHKLCVICRREFTVRKSEAHQHTTCGDPKCHRKRMSELGKRAAKKAALKRRQEV